MVKDGQRAGRVESDSTDGLWADVVQANGPLYSDANAAPDVGGGLFLGVGGSVNCDLT